MEQTNRFVRYAHEYGVQVEVRLYLAADFRQLLERKELADYDRARFFLDEEFRNTDSFTVSGLVDNATKKAICHTK